MKFIFGPLRIDRPALESQWDVLLGIVADLSILVDGRCWLHEEMFPVVELAVCFQRWLNQLNNGVTDNFLYRSMEAEESLLHFQRQNGAWIIRSPLQEYEENQEFMTNNIRSTATQFVEDIQRATNVQLNVKVDRWLKD